MASASASSAPRYLRAAGSEPRPLGLVGVRDGVPDGLVEPPRVDDHLLGVDVHDRIQRDAVIAAVLDAALVGPLLRHVAGGQDIRERRRR